MPPSPQLENGFLRIANELADALARVSLSSTESRIVWFVIRKTYGYRDANGDSKKIDRISGSQFAGATGLTERSARRAIATLIRRQILFTEREGIHRVLYGLQKDYGRWDKPLSEPTVSNPTVSETTGCQNRPQTLSELRGKTLSELTPTKDKKIIDKRNGASDPAFERAWSLFPKRAGGNSKKKAWAAWTARVRAGTATPDELLAGVERYAGFVRATGKEGTEYVQQAATFFGPSEHWKEPWTVQGSGRAGAGGFVG